MRVPPGAPAHQPFALQCGFCGNVCASMRCREGMCVGGDDECPVQTINCGGRCRNVLNDEKSEMLWCCPCAIEALLHVHVA